MIRIFTTQKNLTNMLSGNTIDVAQFGREKTAVYLIIPDEKSTYHFLITTFIKQAYEILIAEAQKETNRTLPIRVNFVLDEEASSEGKYVFELRHNSYGESLIYNENEIVLGGSFVSFPITDIIKEDSAEIIVSHKWYKSAGQGWSSETQEYNYKISYTKGGYEQAPSAFASKATTNLN